MILVVAAISAQRFLLPNVYNLICVYFLFAFWYCFILKKPSTFLYLILSFIFTVDNGGDIYAETPSLIRYAIYLSGLLFISTSFRFNRIPLMVFLVYTAFLLFITMLNVGNIEFVTFTRDIFLLYLMLFSLCAKTSSYNCDKYALDNYKLCLAIIVFIFFECANSFFFYDSINGYLNYHSLKAIVLFPSFYFLVREKWLLFYAFVIVTFFLLVMYVTRMILLTWILLIFVVLSRKLISLFDLRRIALICSLMVFSFFVYSNITYEFDLSATKATNLFLILLSDSDIFSILRSLDPVRYAELVILFDRSFFEIIFGSGLGAGVFDKNNIFSFVGVYDTAFSYKELSTHFFYNFHDLWIDIGLRFGLIAVVLFVVYLASLFSKGDKNLALMVLVLVFCSFFNTAGLIFISLLIMALRCSSSENLYTGEKCIKSKGEKNE
ncbi:hypothetical protein [Shewanella colwelliana]|uniref:hypothetical protein n=1 Tax=Shewanella colwelliana TaxID=23 RepID=UPI0022AE6FA1|nr:hypothetical protein [Shewanella colwelliana]MCZ4336719.1 hypothetical protein [Shewanella colwelliana]